MVQEWMVLVWMGSVKGSNLTHSAVLRGALLFF